LRLSPGTTKQPRNEASEDVTYVIEGTGTAVVAGEQLPLEPGTGLYVPPSASYRFEVDEGAEMVLVSVLSPPPGRGERLAWGRPTIVNEHDQPALSAGDDRSFKLLIEPRRGCRNVTQFVGSIDRSRAPFHTHTYEEVIYILSGEGIVHADDQDLAIVPGSSVFLPPGLPHCLENAGSEVLRLLGVFSPPGSPAGKTDAM